MAYKVNIEKKTISNNNYRKVLFTTEQMQLVVMSLLPGEDIPREKHKDTSQYIRVEDGECQIIVDKKKFRLKSDDSIIIPANTWHYVKNTGKKKLKIYTIYTPPEHNSNALMYRQISQI